MRTGRECPDTALNAITRSRGTRTAPLFRRENRQKRTVSPAVKRHCDQSRRPRLFPYISDV